MLKLINLNKIIIKLKIKLYIEINLNNIKYSNLIIKY